MKVRIVYHSLLQYTKYLDKLKKTFTELLSTAANLTFYEHVEAVPLEDSQQLYQYYLHDYIRNLVLPFDETCMDSVYEVREKLL